MKKLIFVLSLLMLLPMQAMAMQAMSDTDMGAITAQDGVSIAVDDVKIYQNIEYIRYTDEDGTSGVAGSVEISNLRMMVNVNAITSATYDAGTGAITGLLSPGRALQGVYDYAAYNYGNTAAGGVADAVFIAKPITIDVGELPILGAGGSYNASLLAGAPVTVTVGGVQIGLPTMEITQTALTFSIGVNVAGAHNDGASFGTLSIGGQTIAILDGMVEIAAH